MNVYGYAIPAELEAAAVAWMRAAPFALWSLSGYIERRLPALAELRAAGAERGAGAIACRAADRLMQRHRRAGDIEIRDRVRSPVWQWVAGAE